MAMRHNALFGFACSLALIVAGCGPTAPAQPTTAPTVTPAGAPTQAPAAKPTAAPASQAAAPTASTGGPAAPTTAPAKPTAAAAPQPATAAKPGAPSGTLRIGTISEVEAVMPFFASQLVGLSVRMNMFDSLVERDFEGKIVPALAESWTVVDDKTIDFKLRRGVTFHNGQDFTAEDVKFTFEFVLDEANKSPSRGNFTAIQEIRMVDPYAVRMILSRTDARILDTLANSVGILPSKYLTEKGLAEFQKQPVGTGPFKFVEWVKDDHITLEANEAFWDGSYKGKPQVKTVIFRPIPQAATRLADLRSGAVDLVMDVPQDQIAGVKSAGFTVVERDSAQHDYIYADISRDTPLKSKDVRQALNYAVDKETILQTLLGGAGRPLSGPVSPLTLGYNPDVKPFPYDPNKAKQLLASAGVPNGFDVEMDMTTSHRLDLGEAIVAQLREVGIRVKLNVLETAVYNDRWVKKQLSPLYYNRWNTFSDPALLDNLAGCSGFLSVFCSQSAQPHLTAGGSTLDQTKREAAYKEAVKALVDDPFGVYLFQLQSATAHNAKVQGWKAHSTTYLLATNARVQ
jgi:peptide/nickel transport system substrate-binding protein